MRSTAVDPLSGRRQAGPPLTAHTVGVVLRLALLTLIGALVWLATQDLVQLGWVVLLAVSSVPAVVAPHQRVAAPLGRIAEVVVAGLGASAVAVAADMSGPVGNGVGAAAVLPYLAVPLTAATFQGRPLESAGLLSLAATVLTVAGYFTSATSGGGNQLSQLGYLAVCAQWLTLAAIGTITAGAMQRAMLARRAPQPYAEATRLLTQLRQVARQLPGATLDPGSIAEHLLEELRPIGRAERSAVFAASGGGRLEVLAQSGVEGDSSMRAAWETHLDADSAIADAWASQQPQLSSRTQLRTASAGSQVSALVVPLVAGVRTVGLVVLERDGVGGYPTNLTHKIIAAAAPAALRLEAALLFDEVRSLATNEERQRLAREIHDGVAQELAMIGYGIDNAQAGLPDDATQTAGELRDLRAEVTRVITELRLSLFELRTEVDRHGGLTAAIAEFARISGNQAGLKVHLSLDEVGRLPASMESELLRIAQEAITNARKHAFAGNLWVTCTIDPPFALIEVSDDGQGLSDQRSQGSYGLAIMAERAERIRGRLEIRAREPSGTTVAVVVGGATRQDSRARR